MATTQSTNVTVSDDAQDHDPIGDSDHVSYGQDYYWECSCGSSSPFFGSLDKQTHRAEQHAAYCDGHTRVEVSY